MQNRTAGFSFTPTPVYVSFVGNAVPFNRDTIQAIENVWLDIQTEDGEGSVAPNVRDVSYSGPLTYVQEKGGAVRETVVRMDVPAGYEAAFFRAVRRAIPGFRVTRLEEYRKAETQQTSRKRSSADDKRQRAEKSKAMGIQPGGFINLYEWFPDVWAQVISVSPGSPSTGPLVTYARFDKDGTPNAQHGGQSSAFGYSIREYQGGVTPAWGLTLHTQKGLNRDGRTVAPLKRAGKTAAIGKSEYLRRLKDLRLKLNHLMADAISGGVAPKNLRKAEGAISAEIEAFSVKKQVEDAGKA